VPTVAFAVFGKTGWPQCPHLFISLMSRPSAWAREVALFQASPAAFGALGWAYFIPVIALGQHLPGVERD